MARGGGIRVVVGIMVGVREWGKLCGEGELLWLWGLLVLLLVRGLGGRDVEDAVAILLLVLRVVMGRSFGGIRRLCGALVGLVVVRVMLVLRRLWRVCHETREFFGKVHGGLG
jgi:hypothetical protein